MLMHIVTPNPCFVGCTLLPVRSVRGRTFLPRNHALRGAHCYPEPMLCGVHTDDYYQYACVRVCTLLPLNHGRTVWQHRSMGWKRRAPCMEPCV
jgi:hypothetical protein